MSIGKRSSIWVCRSSDDGREPNPNPQPARVGTEPRVAQTDHGPHPVGHPLDDGQTQARTLRCRSWNAIEGIENALAFSFGNAAPLIGDFEDGGVTFLAQRDVHATTGR